MAHVALLTSPGGRSPGAGDVPEPSSLPEDLMAAVRISAGHGSSGAFAPHTDC
jgi:hypothetical protein